MPDQADPVLAAAQAGIDAGIFPGVVIVAGRRAGVQLTHVLGHARITPHAVAMRPDAIFDVASITKVVATTTAVAICIDAGLLDLDAPAHHYLSAMNLPTLQRITLRHLVTHTAGLSNEKFNELNGEALLHALSTRTVLGPPGTHWEYCCPGFVILGLIVEAVTHGTFDSFCHTRIFEPLGMRDTRFGPPETASDRARLVATERLEPHEVSDGLARRAGRAIGNAGLFTAAADLARFAQMMLCGGTLAGTRILSPRAHALCTTNLNEPPLPARALGWDLRPPEQAHSRGQRFSKSAYGHSGWTGQSIWIDPEHDLFTVVLTNRTHPVHRGDDDGSHQSRARIANAIIDSLESSK